MKTILLSNHYEGQLLEMLTRIIDGRFHLKVLKEVSRAELLTEIEDADYLLSSGRLEIDKEVIQRAKNLKMIQRTGVGVDRIDLDVLKRYGIPLYVNRGVNAVSVAEYTVMLMLQALKISNFVSFNMHNGKWEKTHDGIRTHELSGKDVGLIGMGNIGKTVAGMLMGFNVQVVYNSRTRLSKGDEKRLHIKYVGLDELLKRSDIVSLHCPYDKNVGYLISEREIGMMKEGAILINTARGRLVKEEALLAALRSGKLSACGLDTFEEEPLPDGSEFRKMKQVILSPHIAGLSYEAYERMLGEAIGNILLFDSGNEEKIVSSLFMG